MQKLAVFGGTFNPVHNGHLHLVRQFAQRIGADRVLLIPTKIPPHKVIRDLAPARDRLEMCRLAVERDGFEVSAIEIERDGPSYTSDTLLAVKRENPGSELFFITGEDMFLTLGKWHEPEKIYSLATVCAAPRSERGCEALNEYAERVGRAGAKTMICDIEFLPISSTMVRNAARKKENLSAYVPQAVADYIYRHHLYSEESYEL
ncbi:nicotinate (nicotinamide) nucleotide adenylyltransferase [Caproiciproducens sp. NJN-50]|uniref:nicotinate-nucleotide adenylyltransferase n=1 Tax=Acutalibacteraceae TaxID=3082771 RepID=UPI000FFE1F11|nr:MULTISPECIES: nicotinate-nucleotide adenylyltransferase [Acutalibacteraceae]QAT49764.1 nicotinate (nicotinamide) nucleotide adenylyltransferase [Caproiciproducens sp. NJN-50]